MEYILILVLAGFAFLLIRQILINRKPTYIASATVVSRRRGPGKCGAKYASTWNHYTTFRLNDGEELELSLGEAEYYALEPGMSGTLRWQDTDFREFETND